MNQARLESVMSCRGANMLLVPCGIVMCKQSTCENFADVSRDCEAVDENCKTGHEFVCVCKPGKKM